jgi:hypothetical protein
MNLFPHPTACDSARLDNAVERLVTGGRDVVRPGIGYPTAEHNRQPMAHDLGLGAGG